MIRKIDTTKNYSAEDLNAPLYAAHASIEKDAPVKPVTVTFASEADTTVLVAEYVFAVGFSEVAKDDLNKVPELQPGQEAALRSSIVCMGVASDYAVPASLVELIKYFCREQSVGAIADLAAELNAYFDSVLQPSYSADAIIQRLMSVMMQTDTEEE